MKLNGLQISKLVGRVILGAFLLLYGVINCLGVNNAVLESAAFVGVLIIVVASGFDFSNRKRHELEDESYKSYLEKAGYAGFPLRC